MPHKYAHSLVVLFVLILWLHCRNKVAGSREVSKPRVTGLDFCNRPEIWQVPRQHRRRDACQISQRYNHYNIQSHSFETSCQPQHTTIKWERVHINYSDVIGAQRRLNRWILDCLFNSLFRLTRNKPSKPCTIGALRVEPTSNPWIPRTMEPVMQPTFPCHDHCIRCMNLRYSRLVV